MNQDASHAIRELESIAALVNSFESEAVQLRVLEFVLENFFDESEEAKKDPPKHRRKKKISAAARSSHAPKQTPRATKRKPNRNGGGSGAVATLTKLAEGEFFKKPRTINDLIKHCKDNMARTFKANEFSGKLGRMVRNKELNRTKNKDNQYEYQKP